MKVFVMKEYKPITDVTSFESMTISELIEAARNEAIRQLQEESQNV